MMTGYADSNRPYSRLYQDMEDLKEMQEMLMGARAQTDDWRYPHVGELLWNFFMVDCHLVPSEHIRLWHDSHDSLIGYAILGEDPAFEAWVAPEYAWTGLETEALTWAETHLADLRKKYDGHWAGNLSSGARQDDEPRIGFLEEHGFRRGEYAEVNMMRSLDDPLPEELPPDGCQVREVTREDIPTRAAAQREVWKPWTVGNVRDENYGRFMQLPGYQRQLDVVAVTPEGVVAAYVNGWADQVNRIGDFGPLGTLEAYRRRGWMRAVLLECLRRMQAIGMERVCVSTGVENKAARMLYESIGFKVVNEYHEYRLFYSPS